MTNQSEGSADPRFAAALDAAQQLMAALPELEPTSALKQAASENGILFGDEMTAFVTWALRRLGI